MKNELFVNRYKVIDKLGEGGMGIVWRVFDTVTQKTVALKQYYKKDFDGKENTKVEKTKMMTLSTISTATVERDLRFMHEFHTMVKLRHPNTVHVFDCGVLENGDDYLTMEIVTGEDLSDILEKRQLSFSEIYKIFIKITQVLNFIHSRLLVHRDIKPANIRITSKGDVKMMDFGLMDQMGLPSNGKISGTIAYLPPELAQGGIIDARSDLYSLGCLGYELVTRQTPFNNAEIIEIIKQHINKQPTSMKTYRPDVPETLDNITLKLLEKKQEDRYQNTAELLNDLIPASGEKITVETLEQKKSYLNCSALIGRESEMKCLKETFSKVLKGKGQSVFVAAPAGVGKSRLIQEFKLKVQLAKIPYLEGRCFEQGITSYQPISDALRWLIPLTKKEVVDKYGDVLIKILPELKDSGYLPAPALEEGAERIRLFDTVCNWLKEISDKKTLVMTIEDLHWADSATIEMLNALIRELKDHPIFIIGVYRDDEVDDASAIFQTEEEQLTYILKLSTLDESNVALLIKGMLGKIDLNEEFLQHVVTATGGNAFFVTETMRALIEEDYLKLERGQWILPVDVKRLELPTSIEVTIVRRLNLLSEDALYLARIAAVVGKGLDLSFLQSLSGMQGDKLFELIDELIERQFVKTEDKQYVFTHDRVRETLYGQLGEDKRREMHEQVGEIIEFRFIEDKTPVIGELAYHFSRGKDKARAISYLIQSGDSLKSNRDLTSANIIWRDALNILEEIEYPNKETLLFHLRNRLVEINYFTDPHYGVKICERQAEELKRLVNIEPVVKIMRILFWFINLLPLKIGMRIKDKLESRPMKDNIKKDYPTIILYMVRAYGAGGISAFFSGDMAKAAMFAEQCFRYLPDFKGTGYAILHAGNWVVHVYTGKTKTSQKRFKKAYDILDALLKNGLLKKDFDRYVHATIFYACISTNVLMGNKINWNLWKKGMQYTAENKFFDILFLIITMALIYKMYRGMYKSFQENAAMAKDMLRKTGRPPILESYYYGYVAGIETICGHYDKAIEAVEKFLLSSEKVMCHYQICVAKMYKAYLIFKRGDKKEGISSIKKVIVAVSEQNYICTPRAMSYLAEMYVDINELDKAEEMIVKTEEFNKKFEEPHNMSQARILILKADILQKKKKYESCQDNISQVLKLSDDSENPLLKAWAYEMQAKIFKELTQYVESESKLSAAQKIYNELGIERNLV